MAKKLFFQGIGAGILSAVACIIYNRIYFFATEIDFSKVVNIPVLVGINMLACMLAAAGYGVFKKILKKNSDIFFNFTFTILSFASVIFPISISLPLDIKNPELFPGLTVPMHFFPALAWFTIRPLFIKETIT
jgi:hypothetical protein